MFVLVLFELPTFCLHSFIRNWVVLNKEDGESFFSLPILLCFGKITGATSIYAILLVTSGCRICPAFTPGST